MDTSIETYGRLSPSSRGRFNAYHPDLESFETLVAEVNEAEGEYDQQMNQVNRQIGEVERVKAQITETGMSRSLVTTVREIVEKDDMLEEKGLSLESFTTFPSRVGLSVALEELDEKYKNILLGGAVVLGVGIILKIIHMIYKFFKGRSISSAETEKKQKEVAEKIQKVREAEVELEKLKREQGDIAEAINEFQQSVKQQREEFAESIESTWTHLLEAALLRNDYTQPLEKVINNFKEYEGKIEAALDICGTINGSLETWLEDRDASSDPDKDKKLIEKLENLIKPVYKDTPPATMRKNIQAVIDRTDSMKELSSRSAKLTQEIIDKVSDEIQDSKHLIFLDKLRGWDAVKESDMFNKDKLEKTKSIMELLNETILKHQKEEPKLKEAEAKVLTEFTKYLSDVYRGFLKVSTICQILGAQYDRFLNAYDREYRISERNIESAMKKMGKEKLSMLKFGSKLLTSLRDKLMNKSE